MLKLYIIPIILIILVLLIELLNKKENNTNNENLYNYMMLKGPMTETEKKFCKTLKNITDKYNLIIIPQIQLQKIFKTYNKKDITAFNKIKSKSIDFAIVDSNYNYKIFIELDDNSHYRKDRQKRDVFVNELFEIANEKYKNKLVRIKVQNNYNLEELENIIKEVAN